MYRYGGHRYGLRGAGRTRPCTIGGSYAKQIAREPLARHRRGCARSLHFFLFSVSLNRPPSSSCGGSSAPDLKAPTPAGAQPDAVLSIPIEYETPTRTGTPSSRVYRRGADGEAAAPAPRRAAGSSSPGPEGRPVSEALRARRSRRRRVPDDARGAPIPISSGSLRGRCRSPGPTPAASSTASVTRSRCAIQVDEDGAHRPRRNPRRATTPPTASPPRSSPPGQIVFAPGTIGGKPVKMWTEIRIDFRSKS